MPDTSQVAILEKGVDAWNTWRLENSEAQVDLSGLQLSESYLPGINFSRANLRDADIAYGSFANSNFNGADMSRVEARNATFMDADLRGAILCDATLADADMRKARMSGANLTSINLNKANLQDVDFSGSLMPGAMLRLATVFRANFSDCDLSNADLSDARLNGVKFLRASLNKALLIGTDLSSADFTGADLRGAQMWKAMLVETRLDGANLTGARIFGIAAWDVYTDEATIQQGLIITEAFTPEITVDELEIAQFIYLMLENRKIRRVLDTITSKAVLILGRFTDERKHVLECVRTVLRDQFNMVPILFDFPPSTSRDLTETVQLLASLCRFVIADLTDAKSIPQELSHIVPLLPSVPVQPIILSTQREYAMFEHWRRFPNVLPEFHYENCDHLLYHLKSGVINPVEVWEEATDKKAAQGRQLREMVQAQKLEIAMLKEKLQSLQ